MRNQKVTQVRVCFKQNFVSHERRLFSRFNQRELQEFSCRYTRIDFPFSISATSAVAGEGWATVHDGIVVYEVMVKNPDQDSRSSYRKMEQRFRQDKLLIRAQEICVL